MTVALPSFLSATACSQLQLAPPPFLKSSIVSRATFNTVDYSSWGRAHRDMSGAERLASSFASLHVLG